MVVAAAKNEYGNLFLWSLILVAIAVIGFMAVVWVKRRIQSQETAAPALGFSLADLRELHRTGKISDEEYERARGKMAASLKKDEKAQTPKKLQ